MTFSNIFLYNLSLDITQQMRLASKKPKKQETSHRCDREY